MKYRMYVDECGNPDLASSDNPIHRFLSLTGVIIDLDYVKRTLFTQMESLKSRYFGSHPDEPIVLHRKELSMQSTLLKHSEIKSYESNLILSF